MGFALTRSMRASALIVLALSACLCSAAAAQIPRGLVNPRAVLRQTLRGGGGQPSEDTQRLMDAVVSGETDRVAKQLHTAANVYWTNSTHAAGWTCLHEAIVRGHEEIAALLIEKGGDGLVLATDEENVTTLHVAAAEGMESIVRSLLKKGGQAMLHTQDGAGRTCLHGAAQQERLGTVKILAAEGGDNFLHLKDSEGFTALHWAAHEGNVEISAFLAEQGGKKLLKVAGTAGLTCLHVAAAKGHRSVVTKLVELGGKELEELRTEAGQTCADLLERFESIEGESSGPRAMNPRQAGLPPATATADCAN